MCTYNDNMMSLGLGGPIIKLYVRNIIAIVKTKRMLIVIIAVAG